MAKGKPIASGLLDADARRAERSRTDFERRRKAALEGLHLPTERELLAGMPFLGNDIQRDMHAFAERLLPRLRKKAEHIDVAIVVDRLEQLTIGAGVDEIQALAEALRAASGVPSGVRSWRLRCRLYLAHLGDHRAAFDLARDAVTLAISLRNFGDAQEASVGMVRVALGWLSVAASAADFDFLGDGDPLRAWHGSPEFPVSRYGYELVALVEQQALIEAADTLSASAAAQPEPTPTEAAPDEPPQAASALSAVVFREVGNAITGEGRKVERELKELLGKPLLLVPMPDLAVARETLREEFPYATEVVDRILMDVPTRAHIQLRPTILVGPPGCGKTRFARRLLTVLDVPHDVIPCGGIADGAFAGTARRWSSGEPSLPVALITRYRMAGPGAVLDEIEKVGTSRHNGQVHDALLAFLERETACRFHDPYVQAPCDLSHVTWVMTANTLDGVSAPLRDRCRLIPFPEPGHEYLPILAHRIMADILAEQGLDHRWLDALDEVETTTIAEAWPGGSLRTLRRMIEVVLRSREVRH